MAHSQSNSRGATGIQPLLASNLCYSLSFAEGFGHAYCCFFPHSRHLTSPSNVWRSKLWLKKPVLKLLGPTTDLKSKSNRVYQCVTRYSGITGIYSEMLFATVAAVVAEELVGQHQPRRASISIRGLISQQSRSSAETHFCLLRLTAQLFYLFILVSDI